MKSVPAAIAVLMLVLTISSAIALFKGNSPTQIAGGEVRCEGAGAIVVNIDGMDYAANGMASRRYPPIQRVWNASTHPEVDVDRIIITGLTLCDWGAEDTFTSALSPASN